MRGKRIAWRWAFFLAMLGVEVGMALSCEGAAAPPMAGLPGVERVIELLKGEAPPLFFRKESEELPLLDFRLAAVCFLAGGSLEESGIKWILQESRGQRQLIQPSPEHAHWFESFACFAKARDACNWARASSVLASCSSALAIAS